MKKLLFLTLLLNASSIVTMELQKNTAPLDQVLNYEAEYADFIAEQVALDDLAENQNKKRKANEVTQIQYPFYRKIYFDPQQIKEAIHNTLMQEEGKILAAYYMVTSDALTDTWVARKYVQHYEKAKKNNNLKLMINAAKQLTNKKNDILIVDKENLNKDPDALKKLYDHGITVLVRNKNRNPNSRFEQMHLKFMLIFDEKNENPKLLIKGSYNFTNQAQYNFEDVEITNDTDVIQRYHEQHLKLREFCEEFSKPQAQN